MDIQLFTPYWLDLKLGRELWFVQKTEAQSLPLLLTSKALGSAYYMNELLLYSLKQPEPSPQLYARYHKTMNALSKEPEPKLLEIFLRQFEWALLQHCGVAFSFAFDDNNCAIDAEKLYHFIPQLGFVIHTKGILGSTIQRIHQNHFEDIQTLPYSKHIMRKAIQDLIQNRPIRSRKIFSP
jgi:DNA repair protein RecO (recombination protein O)